MTDTLHHEHNEAVATEATKPVRKKKTSAKVADVPFEVAMARLEEIVRALENGGDAAALDESLRLYEEGVALVRRLSAELDTAEQRVKILQRTADGEIKPEDFVTNAD